MAGLSPLSAVTVPIGQTRGVAIIIGAMAEFERSLIQERVRAGLRNAKLKGKTLGRPRRIVNGDEMARLREQGASFREIAEAVGASPGTVRTRRCANDLSVVA